MGNAEGALGEGDPWYKLIVPKDMRVLWRRKRQAIDGRPLPCSTNTRAKMIRLLVYSRQEGEPLVLDT